MYLPEAFREDNPEQIRGVVERYPLATLVTAGSGGLMASHLPMLYVEAEGFGVLRGHLARVNPQAQEASGVEALAIFSGPDHYVSPAWYPSKREHGKVVPTWNYVVVHAYGALRLVHDVSWLLDNVRALSDFHERTQGGAWKVDDAPPDYIAGMLKAIVGVELKITRLEGKVKASQNRPVADREAVIEALEKRVSDDAREMAQWVRDKLRNENPQR